MEDSMVDSRIDLKNRWVAGILAFLVPGAGHLYQGRFIKAAIYFVCILGLFFTGMAMAEWRAVQTPTREAVEDRQLTSLLKYSAQAGVGVAALYGLVQRERYYDAENVPIREITEPFSAPFEGTAEIRTAKGTEQGHVEGTLSLEPAEEQFGKRSITGTFEGQFEGKPVEYQLSRNVDLAKPIDADPERQVAAAIVEKVNGREETIGRMFGTIPRNFLDWYQVPASEHHE